MVWPPIASFYPTRTRRRLDTVSGDDRRSTCSLTHGIKECVIAEILDFVNMCILLTTTSHPDYPFILLSNRDEFFARPTKLATKRKLENGSQILSPLDLGRPEHGSWIGITSSGRLAVLVNYREQSLYLSEVSRGILPLDYLESNLPDREWFATLEDKLSQNSTSGRPVTLSNIGGFSLVYGKLELDPTSGKIKPLNIMSNRGDFGKLHATVVDTEDLHQEIAAQETFGLSNSLYYAPWKKVQLGTSKLSAMIQTSIAKNYSLDEIIESCFEILSTDTYDSEIRKKGSFMNELEELQNSIFIPPLQSHYDLLKRSATVGKYYGTRTQTVIALHKSGTLHYYERDLHLEDSDKVNFRAQHFKFDTCRQ